MWVWGSEVGGGHAAGSVPGLPRPRRLLLSRHMQRMPALGALGMGAWRRSSALGIDILSGTV